MKINNWERYFESRILRRGENYFVEGAVRFMEWDGEKITAVVSGTRSYDVEIEMEIDIDGGDVRGMYCSCPYAIENNCKHMAAVLCAASQDDFPGAERYQRQITSRESLKNAAESLNETNARELLWRFARKYPEIAENVMMKAAGSVTKEQIQAWKKQVISLTVKYSDKHGYIDYENAGKYTSALRKLLNEKIPMLLECGLSMDAFDLTCKALREASEIDMDYEESGIYSLYGDCEKHWHKIISRMNREERHKMFDWFQANYRRWSMANEMLEEFLFGGYGQEGEFQDEEFLRRKLELLDEQIGKADEGSYDQESLTMRRVEIMKKLSMPREEITAYLIERFQMRAVRKYLTDEALRESRYDDAIKLLQESKKIDGQYPGAVSEHSGKLIEIYQEQGRVEELRAELLFQMERIWQKNLRYVKILKQITPDEQWLDLREKLLSMPNLSGVYGILLEEEKLYDRLLKYVQKSGKIEIMDRFAKNLKEQYPKEVLDFYLPCLRRGMEYASNRAEYIEQIRHLKDLTLMRGGEEAVAELVRDWKTAYPRRRAMIEELRKYGF